MLLRVITVRDRLSNRRPAVTTEISAGKNLFIASIGFDSATGRPAELFLCGSKDGTDMAAILDDVSVVVSIALQSGLTARELEHSVLPGHASVIGAALDLIADYEAELTKSRWPAPTEAGGAAIAADEYVAAGPPNRGAEKLALCA